MQIVRDLGGLYHGTKRPGAPCHVQEKGGGHGEGTRRISFTAIRKRACRAVLPTGIRREDGQSEIYDEMMDFAKYAFNKSHAACLCGGRLPDGLSEILLSGGIHGGADDLCHGQPGKGVGVHSDLPPDGNRDSAAGYQRGRAADSPYPETQSGTDCAAIKSVGRPVVDAIIAERRAGGPCSKTCRIFYPAHVRQGSQ